MTSSVMTPDSVRVRRVGPSLIFALMPLWVFVFVAAFSGDFLRLLGTKPPDILGIPLATVVEVSALAWMVVGLVVIWTAASRLVEAIALTVFTIPATVVIVLTPLLIAGLLNLA